MTDRTWFTIRALSSSDDEEDPNRPGYLAKAEGDAEPDPEDPTEADETDEPSAEVLIYDEIGAWGIGAADFDRALKSVGDVKTINMRINSPGGDSFAGIAIYNMLKQHPATVKARVDGIAASAASLIAMAGDRITMPENTFMVVHEPVALAIGPASVMRSMADDLDRVAVSYANTYAARSGQTLEAVRSLMAEDRLMTAAECRERGYSDETAPAVPMRASFALDRLPDKHRAMLSTVFAATSGGAEDPAGDPPVPPGSPAPAGSVPDAPPETVTTEPPALDEPALIYAAPPEAYGAGEMTATLELCALAGLPAAAAQKFISSKTPVADVRARLLEAKAAAADAAVIIPYSTNEGGGGPGTTTEQVVAGKRRLQAIIRRADKDKIPVERAAYLIDNHL